MLDLSKPVQTRDGRPAKIVSTSMSGSYQIGIIVTQEDGSESFDCVDRRGRAYAHEETPGDLVNTPVRTEAYSRILRRNGEPLGLRVSSIQHRSLAVAKGQGGTSGLVGFLKITTADGEVEGTEFIPA